MFIERVLLKFSFGETREDGSWCINNGIKTKQEVINAIQQELLDERNKDSDGKLVSNYTLVKCKTECDIIV